MGAFFCDPEATKLEPLVKADSKYTILLMDLYSTAGVSENVLNGNEMPINGLRYPEQGSSSGWYIWCGEYSDHADFFKPLHLSHLVAKYSFIEKYLNLPAGTRFQLDDKGYEDIWEDKDLL